ncbi:MAK10-like protein [Tanacetum coccineum]
MGDENPCRTLGDYSRPSHEGYRNTIKVPNGNDLVPLRSDTIRLVQNGCSFHELRFEDPNQHLKDFLKIVDSIDLNDLLQKFPHHGIDLWLQIQIFYDHANPITRRTIDQAAGGKLRDKNDEESWALLEDLALYDNKSWNDPRDFAKPVKAISMPHGVPSTSDCRLIKLENQVQSMMEAHLAQTKPVQVNKIASSCEICSGPHDTQYCMEDPERAFVEYASTRTDEAENKWYTFKPEENNLGDTYNPSWKSHQNLRTSSVSSSNPTLSSLKSFNRSKLTHDPKSARVSKGWESLSLQGVTKLAIGRLVNGSPCDRIGMIIEDLDLEPKIDAMMREFLESPSRWKELSKETSSKILPSGDGSRGETFKPIASLVSKGNLKQTQARSFPSFNVKGFFGSSNLTADPDAVSIIKMASHLSPDVVWDFQTASPESGLQSSSIFTPVSNLAWKFLKEPRDNTFSGSKHEDPNEDIKKVLEIADLFYILKVSDDEIFLRAFPMSLIGAASQWLRNEPSGSIVDWETLKKKFLSKYCPLARTAKKMEEINNFQQEPDETLYNAWE